MGKHSAVIGQKDVHVYDYVHVHVHVYDEGSRFTPDRSFVDVVVIVDVVVDGFLTIKRDRPRSRNSSDLSFDLIDAAFELV
jgi:hypothetical protein